ncbi:FBXL4-like protein [Mya arenaria]|uniref:FBXL4-like protein n=1 Tax=Mya arenaria TaxID=6604 RepID=A0ABY7DD47_MYAAR|nr:FBXL4-like protein [Mya arenaria]
MLSRVKKMLAFKSHNSPPKDTDPIDEYCKKGKKSDIVIFNALEVSDFSSQYGSETSISYTASNLAGRGNVYPNYGDFTQACVFRTYGDWWDRAPSGRQRFARTPEWFTSQDYIVRILACDKSMGSCVDTGNQSLIRLELCHKHVIYYTELDYVLLYGKETVQAECCNDIQETQGCTDDPETDNGYFGLLPVNDIALKGMLGRSRFLQRLNLSWCHGNILTEQAFCWYIEECGESLQSLYLSSCSFVTDNCLDAIVRHCKNLSELELDSCSRVSHEGLQKLASLSKLQRLNLYRTMIDQKALSTIIISCPELRHLNIGATHGIHNCDEILQVFNIKSSSGSIRFLVENCKKIKKLFLTANRTVDDEDLLAIANNCPDLEQLDILGTRQVSADIATRLLQQCEKLEFFDVSFCTGIDKIRLHDWSTRFPRVDVKKSFQN